MADETAKDTDAGQPDPDAEKARLDELIRRGEEGELSESELLELDEEIAEFERGLRSAAEEHRLPQEEEFLDAVRDLEVDQPESENDPEEIARELAEKVARIRGEAKLEKDEPDIEFKLQDIEGAAARARSREHTRLVTDDKKRKQDRKDSHGLAVGLQAAYTILGLPIFCFFVGKLIDYRVGGNLWQSWLTVIGAFLGVTVAIYQLNKLNR